MKRLVLVLSLISGIWPKAEATEGYSFSPTGEFYQESFKNMKELRTLLRDLRRLHEKEGELLSFKAFEEGQLPLTVPDSSSDENTILKKWLRFSSKW